MKEMRRVWDIPLRLFHWVLVLGICASWITAELGFEYTQLHFYIGYCTLGLIAFRIIWGFVGPRHARFVNFVPGPGKALAYARTLLKRDATPTVGHNPLGALVVLLMIAMVGAQAVTGLFLIDNTEIWIAPYHAAVNSETAERLAAFHHLNFDVLLWVIALHLLAILFYRVYKRQSLVVPMLTGNKPAAIVGPQEIIESSQLLKAVIVALICAAGVWLLLSQAPPPATDEYSSYE
jgi:cytochrome b